MRHIHRYGLEKIKSFEGFRGEAYQDSTGVWTIGYGHTAAAGAPFPEKGMSISKEEAEILLRKDLEIYEKAVTNLVQVPVNDNQFAALVSLCFNIGVGAFSKSTLLKKLNLGLYEEAGAQFMRWTKAKGQVLQGLVNRRYAESALWFKNDFIASHYVQAVEHKSSIYEKSHLLVPVFTSLSGCTALFTSNGPFQWALAFTLIAAFFYYIWFSLCKG